MSNLKQIQDYVFAAKYARTINGRKESWEAAVARVMGMHFDHLTDRMRVSGANWDAFSEYFNKAYSSYLNQEVLGAQRALQWGGPQLLKNHLRGYNCASTYVNRVEVFKHTFEVLLAGAGLGYSVQRHHVDMLPVVEGPSHTGTYTHVIADSIEGWSDALGALVESYYYGLPKPDFDDSEVRPKGALISGGFKAPGPKPLMKALSLVDELLSTAKGRKLTPFEAHSLICIIADAVISGGVRRAALLALFSADDIEMMKCKTGDWWIKRPYLARANNSVAILPDTPKKMYDEVFKYVKEFGEPGIIFLKDSEQILNPCAEISMYPTWINEDGTKEYGFSFCNLTEINGSKVHSYEDFERAAIAASILGTIQASYTDFPYLGEVTEKIVRRDALIGVGITGMAENPHILFNAEMQRKAAKAVVETNALVASIIGINYAARCTTIKPAGTSSSLLGTSSGIHPFDSKRYIRHIQVNKQEQVNFYMEKYNPMAVSDYTELDNVIAFPVDKTNENIITKHDLTALEFLNGVMTTQNNWIEAGTNWDHPSYEVSPQMTHNVSNTCNVKPDEWHNVQEYLWYNRESFCGVSMLGTSSSLNYKNAPFTEVLDEVELSKKYGAAAMMAGGLNVDGIHAFGDLWAAIDTALGRGEELKFSITPLLEAIKKNTEYTDAGPEFVYYIEGVRVDSINAIMYHHEELLRRKQDWVRRFHGFAKKYLNGNLEETANCLKEVSILHKWMQLKRMKTVPWSEIEFEDVLQDAGAQTGAACSGGHCDISYEV